MRMILQERPTQLARARELVEEFGSGGRFSEPGEYPLDAVLVSTDIGVGHGVGDQDYVVPVFVRRTRGGFDAGAGRDSGQHDLRYLVASQEGVQRGAGKSTPPLLRHAAITRLRMQFFDQIGPVGRRVGVRSRGFSPARCPRPSRLPTRPAVFRGEMHPQDLRRAGRSHRQTRVRSAISFGTALTSDGGGIIQPSGTTWPILERLKSLRNRLKRLLVLWVAS